MLNINSNIISKPETVAAAVANMEPLNHKDMTKHLRNRIAKSGIKARVRLQESCGVKWIQVAVPAFDISFTENEQRTIRTIAQVNGLTLAQGMEIDVEQMTNPRQFDFVFHGDGYYRNGSR